MTSHKIIERLQKKGWFIKCETTHEVALVLNACLDADVRWKSGRKASQVPCGMFYYESILIGRDLEEPGLTWHEPLSFSVIYRNCKDITECFFEELRNN